MITLAILLILVFLVVISVQIAKVTELSETIRGEEVARRQKNNSTARALLIFLVVFLVGSIGSAIYYKNSMLGYGPLQPASAHGGAIDSVFNITLFFTGIVFVLTHIALFWFSYKYRENPKRKAMFLSHDNTLEMVWTGIPVLVMTFLVVKGLIVWNDVMADVGPNEDVIEIEATGYQFAWDIRYPGPDGELGDKNYTLIKQGINPLGQNWEDERNHDDFLADEIYLPVNKKVRVRITAKDVLHNFYLPHFRVKMDAVPGLPSYFIFTPTVTTEDYRNGLRAYPEWNVPADPEDPESAMKWQEFNFELACAELCGTGHWSMKKIVKIVSDGEYKTWSEKQKSYYMTNIRNTDNDPNKGKFLTADIAVQREAFFAELDKVMTDKSTDEVSLTLRNINFKTGSASLTPNSKYELNNLMKAMDTYPDLNIAIQGYTDNVGDPSSNLTLSEARANTVMNYLSNGGVTANRMTAQGYGEQNPVATNDTPEGRLSNRRIEFKILKK